MRAVDVIIKKRDRGELTREEIEFFVNGFATGKIADYQVSAWAMAVLLNGMTAQETTDLTLAMANSGEILDLCNVAPMEVDKHSTGGVGDKTTLVVEPLVASCGLPVCKMSGRGLGYSGGTLDKLDSVPGFRTDLTTDEVIDLLRTKGLVLTGQSLDLAPADGKLYAIRDVTGTVPSIPLIASSVMSKKIAGGARAIVLDVKVGSGAFVKNLDEGRELAKLMVAIGKLSGRKVVALLSDMNQPLGHAVGNALEVKEAIDTLHGNGPEDFREHCLTVASHMLVLGEKESSLESARKMAEEALTSGAAWKNFREMIINQNGDVNYVDTPDMLPSAPFVETVKSSKAGYLKWIDAQIIGETSVAMGAGRARKEDAIDHGVGIVVHHKVGDIIAVGDPLFTLHSSSTESQNKARESVLSGFEFSDTPVQPLPLFYEVIQ